MYKPMVLAVVTGVLTGPLLVSTSYGFSLFPESPHSGTSPVIASGMAIALVAGGYYWLQRVRRFSKTQEQREQRQLRAMEKLAVRIEEAERTLFKSNYLTHATRTELRHALDAISTDTVRAIGNLRRHQDLTDSVFRKLMSRSDELFDTLESSMTTVLPESEEGSEPLLMPRRSNPLPLPKPQSRPQNALSSLEPIPLQAATIPMPAKVQPKGANADDASKLTLPDMGMTTMLLGGGRFYAADDQVNELAGSAVDGSAD
ncbi:MULTISPECIES: hypothetical protein [Pseudomonas]|uniref:Uncharacterized protein n=2 Tax=Pseudomonas TaxID=286 RepID=A0A7X1GJB4_9PSED|nr:MULTISPECIES: hypothetical protein [Pseudomonas]MBC2692673.1 hypothetical protein [Pseudomonas kielensis]MDD1008390.1 hypothetical protein [Pseudomonas shahriarae]